MKKDGETMITLTKGQNNHPAHGPVSLDRLHQISEILSKAAAQSDGGNLGHAIADAVKVIGEVLERRKADSEPVAFFSYGSEHCFEHHKTAQDAIDAAEAAIDDYRGDACDGWSEEVDSICWGVIIQTSTKVGERPRTEDDHCDPAIETVCDYALLPEVVHE